MNEKTDEKNKKQATIKLKNQFKVSLILSLAYTLIIIIIYAIDLLLVEPIEITSIEIVLSIVIPAIWIVSIVPALCLAIIGIKSKNVSTAFNLGWIVGNVLANGWLGVFISIFIAPFFALLFYINAIKISAISVED